MDSLEQRSDATAPSLPIGITERIDDLFRLGLTHGDLWAMSRVSRKQAMLLHAQPGDLDPKFIADVAARLDRITPRVIFTRRVHSLRAGGLSMAAIARDADIDEGEIMALLDEKETVADDLARAALERLVAWTSANIASWRIRADVAGYLRRGFTSASLAAWLDSSPGAVDLLITGELDLKADELREVQERLYSIPWIVAVAAQGKVEGYALDRQSALAVARWWEAFDVAEVTEDYHGLAGQGDVDVLVVDGGIVVSVRLLTDQASLDSLMQQKYEKNRYRSLVDLFPTADLASANNQGDAQPEVGE